MEFRNGRPRFTLTDMFVLFVIVALGLGVLLPFIQAEREKSRQVQCINNMRQIGLMFHNSCDNRGAFPASSSVTRNPDGTIAAVDGWSFHVDLLPYACYGSLYDALDVEGGKPLVEPKGPGTPHLDLANTRQPYLVCPSAANSRVAGTGCVTNYKAMGATHIESLMVASPKPTVPLYDPTGTHPDGACFPGTRFKLSIFADGTSYTILAVETTDPTYGVWTVGAECTLVGLPSRQLDPNGQWVPQQFEKFHNHYAPAGYDGEYGDEAPPEIERLRTYLAYDFRWADPGPYVGSDPRDTHGPSSGHPDVVNHLFADASVHGIARRVEFPLYMFGVTRRGGDPSEWPVGLDQED